jgi:hypothetical protein
MRSAVYYPHTELRSPLMLSTALLLWDELEFIVPYQGFIPSYRNRDMKEAVELIGRMHVPTIDEKKLAHERIEEFATRQLPAAFYYESNASDGWEYSMWSQKLLPETWELLREAQLAGAGASDYGMPLQDSAGLALMSILADCCAGDTRARMTDRGDAYKSLTNVLVERSDVPRRRQSARERVIPITLGLIDAGSIPLSELTRFRQREEARSGRALREMRQRYRDRVEEQVKALLSVERERDIAEVQRQFEIDMADDLADLRTALRSVGIAMLFTKEVLVTVLAATGTVFASTQGISLPWDEAVASAGGIAGIGGVLKARSKYADDRRTVMAKHPMAYMMALADR